MMKKVIFILLALTLFLAVSASAEEESSVPADLSTVALPVSPARALRIENEGVQKATLHVEGLENTFDFCIVNDSTVHVIAKRP